MTLFTEALKKLFIDGKISEDKLKELLKDQKITECDYEYITKQ